MIGQTKMEQSEMPKKFATGHALVVGISAYSATIGPLPDACKHDAEDLAELLVSPACGYPTSNVTKLINRDATLENIRAGLRRIIASAKEEDSALIFFSGHGALIPSGSDSSALIPVDCDPGDPLSSVLLESELTSALNGIKAQKLLVMLDACHSGAAASLKAASGEPLRFGYEEKSLSRVASGVGRVVIASSRSSEYSIVFNGQRNSVFTTHALDGLRGKAFSRNDGLIRVFDLFNYVSEQVRRSVPGDQHPIFKATALEDNFPLALYKGGAKSVASGDGGISASANDDWQQLQELMSELYPGGPEDQSIWERAGGDRSKLTLNGSGQARWFSALRTLRLGGGGAISRTSLLHAVNEEFPHHPGVSAAMSK